MITEQDFKDILDQHNIVYQIVYFEGSGKDRNCCVLLGNQLVTLNLLAEVKIMFIGRTATANYHLTWDDWFRFDETDIEFRGIDLAWWKKHKPALQELVQLIESKVSDEVQQP